MRHNVAETGEIDLIRRQQFAQQSLDRVDDAHHPRTICFGYVCHFLRVGIENDAAEAGMIRVADQHDPGEAVIPEDFAAGLRTECAGSG